MQGFTVQFEAQTFSTAAVLFSITPTFGTGPHEVAGLILKTTSEIKSAEEEQLRLRISGGDVSVSGGTSTVWRPLDEFDTAPFNTTVTLATLLGFQLGTRRDLWSESFDVRTGYVRWFPKGQGPRFSSNVNHEIVVYLTAAPADSVTMSGTLYLARVET